MKNQRIAIGAVGILLGLYGVYRLLTEIRTADLELLAVWLIAAVLLHDAIFSPILASVGWVLGRYVPPRARRFLQPGLVVAGLITVIALPLIYRQGTLPSQKGILRQNYTANLTIALGVVLAVMLLAYAVQLVRDRSAHGPEPLPARAGRPLPGHDGSTPETSGGSAGDADAQRASARNDLPPDAQDSSTV